MHICFIDESSTPPKPTAQNPRPYFVIAGVFIPAAQWHGISQEFKGLKNIFRIGGEIKWRFFGADNNDPANSVRHLDQAARDNFRTRMFVILTRRNSIKVVSCVACVRAAY